MTPEEIVRLRPYDPHYDDPHPPHTDDEPSLEPRDVTLEVTLSLIFMVLAVFGFGVFIGRSLP